MDKRAFCFVFMGNLYLCPYIIKYLEQIDCTYDIIYWNRDGISENIGASNIYSFDFILRAEDSKLRKLKGYWTFRKYALQILGKNSYDGVILLQTIAGIILHKVLRKRYLKRYVLDVRDYTLEKNSLFYCIERNVINGSAMTVISSEGYKRFLPPGEYIMIHNSRSINDIVLSKIRNRQKNRDKLVIAFIGYVSYQEQHKKLLRLFKNDNRFELHFIGKGSEQLLPFCEENNIMNIKIVGQFQPEKIMDYYEEVDIIHNLYGNNTPVLDYALSNKLYFAAQLCMPILVCKGTFMEKISTDNGFGYMFDFNEEDACDKLFDYYQNINWIKFFCDCDSFLKRVDEQNKTFNEKIKNFIKGE